MKAYDSVQASRAKGRPTALTYIANLIDGFVELHGDRRFGDDPAVVAGLGWLAGMPVTVIGIEKGSDTPDKVRRNFGSANPEGYRKALRQMKLAEKFRRPVLCLVDTSGAFCGIGAEERGQGQAIAENMYELMTLKTPSSPSHRRGGSAARSRSRRRRGLDAAGRVLLVISRGARDT